MQFCIGVKRRLIQTLQMFSFWIQSLLGFLIVFMVISFYSYFRAVKIKYVDSWTSTENQVILTINISLGGY